MPAVVTHDFFGRDIYDRLYALIGGSRDEADAFLLGNQGPDPLFYLVIRLQYLGYLRLGSTFHRKNPSEVLAAFKEALGVLDDKEQPIGRAYALGFLCHYALDSTAHPLVHYQINSICNAGEPGLSYNGKSEVHAVVESDFDEVMLFTRRGITVNDYNPGKETLRASNTVLNIVSKLFSYVCLTVYKTAVPPRMFRAAVKNYRFTERVIYSPRGIKTAVMGNVERIVRPHSFIQAMTLRPVEATESMFDNHEHLVWENPFTGVETTAGFWDLYDEAIDHAIDAIYAFDLPSFDVDTARALTNNINFEGEPVSAVIVSVEDNDAAFEQEPASTQESDPQKPCDSSQDSEEVFTTS